MKVTKRVLEITAKRPQYMTITDLTFCRWIPGLNTVEEI